MVKKQSSGSGFLASPDLHHQAKIVRKTLLSTVIVTSLWLLAVKNDVNMSLKSNKQKKSEQKKFLWWHLEGH